MFAWRTFVFLYLNFNGILFIILNIFLLFICINLFFFIKYFICINFNIFFIHHLILIIWIILKEIFMQLLIAFWINWIYAVERIFRFFKFRRWIRFPNYFYLWHFFNLIFLYCFLNTIIVFPSSAYNYFVYFLLIL